MRSGSRSTAWQVDQSIIFTFYHVQQTWFDCPSGLPNTPNQQQASITNQNPNLAPVFSIRPH